MRKLRTSDLGRLTLEEFKTATKSPFCVVLDNVRSMNNVGSIFRTSDAFLIDTLYLCGITAQPPHRDITKTAIGAENSVNWIYFERTIDAITDLKNKGYAIYAIEQVENSLKLNNLNYPDGPIAFVLGNEIDGVQQEVIELCDASIEVPQLGTKHSFNVAVTAGIVLWDYAKSKLLS